MPRGDCPGALARPRKGMHLARFGVSFTRVPERAGAAIRIERGMSADFRYRRVLLKVPPAKR